MSPAKSDFFPCPACITLSICKSAINPPYKANSVIKLTDKCSLLRDFMLNDGDKGGKKRVIYSRVNAVYSFLVKGEIENGFYHNPV